MKKLAHLVFRCRERLPAERRGAVHASQGFAVPLLGRSQISFFFQALEKGIEAPGTDAVPVTRQLLDHSKTKDGTFHRVMEDMEPDQPRVQIAVGGDALPL